MKTFTRVALLAGAAVLLGGCSSMPKYFAWLGFGPDKPEVEVQAVNTSSQTAAVDPTDRLYRSAVVAIEDRDYGLALERLQQARERAPQDVRVLNALAVTYDKLGRFDLSARFYAEASAVAPDSPVLTANLAYSHLMQRQYEEMRTFRRKFVHSIPRAMIGTGAHFLHCAITGRPRLETRLGLRTGD